MIAVSPNVASSELSGDTENRESSHWTCHAQHEEDRDDEHQRQQRIHAADARQLVAQVRSEKGEAEMREVDDVQQSPRQADAQAEQSVQAADEHT